MKTKYAKIHVKQNRQTKHWIAFFTECPDNLSNSSNQKNFLAIGQFMGYTIGIPDSDLYEEFDDNLHDFGRIVKEIYQVFPYPCSITRDNRI